MRGNLQNGTSSPFELQLKKINELDIGEIIFVKDYMIDSVWDVLLKLLDQNKEFLNKHQIEIGDGEGRTLDNTIRCFIKEVGYVVQRKITGGVKLFSVRKGKMGIRVLIHPSIIMTTNKVIKV